MHVFQVLPSIMHSTNGELQIDIDFSECLKTYLENFESVAIACPVTTDPQKWGLTRCVSKRELACDETRLRFIELPIAYGAKEFARSYRRTKALLRAEVEKADFLVAAPHALMGDWPTVAIRQAIKLRRPYVIEADIVFESVMRLGLENMPHWKRAVKENILTPAFSVMYRHSLVNSSLALFQGQTVYDAYAKYCTNPHQVHHHIPIYEGDHITDQDLSEKVARVIQSDVLKICYAGRATQMKGPNDWVNVLDELIKRGVKLEAIWLGEGDMLGQMRARINDLGLSQSISFPGLISDRSAVLQTIKESDLFLYCHQTQESARCLGEALACGCPIVGYESAYAGGLVQHHGGGRFSTMSDWGHLVELIQHFDGKRDRLAELISAAAKSGRRFNRKTLLQERMQLIKNFIPLLRRHAITADGRSALGS